MKKIEIREDLRAKQINGGEYRNRTGVHGFAIRLNALNLLKFSVNGSDLFTVRYQGLTGQV